MAPQRGADNGSATRQAGHTAPDYDQEPTAMQRIIRMNADKPATTPRKQSGRNMPWYAVTMGLALLTLAACATSPAARDKAIQQRAQARWDALLAKDYATAYSYLSPGYRSSVSVTDYEINVRARRVQYLSAEYRSHSCEEAACTVEIMVGYKVDRPLSRLPEWKGTSLVEERWVFTDGKWWFLPES
jgi:hypothetical protein